MILNQENKTRFQIIKEILLSNYLYGNISEILEENVLFSLYTTEELRNFFYTYKTSIDLGSCETKLKQSHNISYNDSLYVFKIEVFEDFLNIPKVE